MRFINFYLIIATIPLFFIQCNQKENQNAKQNASNEIRLEKNWKIIASTKLTAQGEQISSESFSTENWFSASVPSTVMGVLLENGLYKDIFVGDEIEKVDKLQFQAPWWYRTEFDISELKANTQLIFEGINYKANIWINGKKAFSNDTIIGSFKIFKLNLSMFVKKGRNTLAVEVFKPTVGEPSIGFVDWNPSPSDDNMGIWRPVILKQTDEISIENPFVQTDFISGNYKDADLKITSSISNHSSNKLKTNINIEFEGIHLEKQIELEANSTKLVEFNSKEYKQLHITNAKLWWPVNLGEPNLFDLTISAKIKDKVSDAKQIRFGIREVKDYLTKEGYRGYKINGEKIVIKGGGWVDDLFLRDSDKKIEDQLKYVKHMNLNTIRLEGFWGNSQKLYSLADQYGLLVMVGWSCHWEWKDYLGTPDDEFGCIKSESDMQLLATSMQEQVLWLRNHPSIFVWVLGSDKLPRPALEHKYIDIFKKHDPSRPYLTTCKELTSQLSGSSAVKMAGPYDYVAPNYWYIDTKNGGAFGFNTETGPGPQPTILESLKKMIPEKNRWPIDTIWNYHCGRHSFSTMNTYIKAFNERYGEAKSVDEFCYKSQIANFEAMRGMFDAFQVNKGKTTGLIQWMLNSAWPEFYWQLYDYYLAPNGAFYGTKSACKPLNLIYNYGNDSIYIVNDYLNSFSNLEVSIKVYQLDGSLKYQTKVLTSIAANKAKAIAKLPKIDGLSDVYLLDLKLKELNGASKSDNFYCLSNKKDEYDFSKTSWVTTPLKSYANFKSLNTLAKTKIETSITIKKISDQQIMTVKLKNKSNIPAMFIELNIKGEKSKQGIYPIFWDDNYITLLPGEERVLNAILYNLDIGNEVPVFSYQAWNL